MAKSSKIIEDLEVKKPADSNELLAKIADLLEAIDWKLWMIYNKVVKDEEDEE